MKRTFRLFLFLIMVFSSSAHALEGNKRVEMETIKEAESYLSGLKTAQARFVQTTHDGQQLVGTFYLNRPGKVRFDYDPPIENFVVADGIFIYFYDSILEEQTNAPIGSTLADFFLRKDFSLDDDLQLRSAKRVDDTIMLEVVQRDDPEGGSITFAFDEDPIELKKWRVVDPQGMITEVELFYLKTGIDLDSSLFRYIDPKKKDGKPSYND
ncbi:MAG: outer membrane lipoprotein carrier protein LolA [Alphaproteobacteria bacterium]|nr:outer membrane lipoprotein carrier protein LolA [Alphaproteobacteria bacterium]